MNPMSTDTQPSEHAMRAAKVMYPHGTSTHMVDTLEELEAGIRRDHEAKARIIDQHAIAPAVAERDRRIAEFATLLQAMLNVAENCDETGYADGVGFVDVDKLHEQVRAILAKHGGAHE